jgi:hypothetical protein
MVSNMTAAKYKKILEEIMGDPRYQCGVQWGKPRRGHPEATIQAHILELESNLAVLEPKLSELETEKLRLLIHTHDTFKFDAQPGVSVTHPKNHATLASRFLAEFCKEVDLLNMVQYHDESYAIFRKLKPDGTFDSQRLLELMAKIRDWDLFMAFMVIDGCTRGKSAAPVEWIIRQSSGLVETRVNETWVIRHEKLPPAQNQ